MKTRVDIELVLAIQQMRNAINFLNFEDIEWYKDGIPLTLTESAKADWKFIGLSNTEFINF